jgi:hypothetical protein
MCNINKLKLSIFVLLATFGIGVSIWLIRDSFFPEPTELQIPKASWEKILFKQINKVTKLSNLEELRKINLATNDLEIRVWRLKEGIVIRRLGENWSAILIEYDEFSEPQKTNVTTLNQPKSGWNVFWNCINELGILTIPEPSDSGNDCSGIDGVSYVIEVNHGKRYRTYFANISYSHCEIAKTVERIGEIIAEEFDNGEGTCKRTEWIPCTRLNREKQRSKN